MRKVDDILGGVEVHVEMNDVLAHDDVPEGGVRPATGLAFWGRLGHLPGEVAGVESGLDQEQRESKPSLLPFPQRLVVLGKDNPLQAICGASWWAKGGPPMDYPNSLHKHLWRSGSHLPDLLALDLSACVFLHGANIRPAGSSSFADSAKGGQSEIALAFIGHVGRSPTIV